MNLEELREEFYTWKITGDRVIHFAIGMTALLILEFIAKPFYRTFIYSNQLYDFHIADTLGNSLGTIAGIFILIALIGHTKTQHYFLIKTITISFVFYELAQPMFGKPIDPWDVLATGLFGWLCYMFYGLIHRNN